MPNKKRKTDYKGAWKEARSIMWQYRGRLALGFALMIVNRLTGLVLPGSSKWVIDEVIGNERLDLLGWLALAAGAATIIQAITSFALSQVLGVAAQRLIAEMRKQVQQHVMRLPTRFFTQHKSGELISRIMTDAEGVRNLIGTGLVHVIGGLMTASITLSVLFWLNWQITTITLVILAFFGISMAYAFTYLRPVFRLRGQINAEVTGRLAEGLGGIQIVKSYTAEKREDLVFARGIHRLFRNIAKTVMGVSSISALTTAVVGMIGVLLILMGGRAVVTGAMTTGDLVMYLFFTGLVAAPLVQIARIGTQISEAFAGLDRIREIRSLATEEASDELKEPLESVEGDIVFENVWFEYDKDVPVLRDVSFAAPAGSTTALVGSSGSGKSTLIGLVMAFHKPLRGRLLVDGRDITTIRLRDYRSNLGVVLQDNFLFDGTIADNIRYSRPGASLDEVKAVSRIAHCDEFIERFENGYDTIVGERGVKLSGGQRQRVAIARAILADPSILILDEATSSLDSESEALIQDGLNNLRRGRTTFVIAHRLSTIVSADQILVLEGGEVIESGTHDELMALGGRYSDLYNKQYKREMNLFVNPGEEMSSYK